MTARHSAEGAIGDAPAGQGVRAHELAERLGWDGRVVHEGLAALRATQLLLLDETTAVFAVPFDRGPQGPRCAACRAKAPCARCRSLAAEAAIAALEAAGSTGMTVPEWAARVGCEPAAVRVQFDGWFREKLLRRDPATNRYSLPVGVKELWPGFAASTTVERWSRCTGPRVTERTEPAAVDDDVAHGVGAVVLRLGVAISSERLLADAHGSGDVTLIRQRSGGVMRAPSRRLQPTAIENDVAYGAALSFSSCA